jgi:BirA family transcriptional regulator, biotin operon repressor / biotin---[acetyl-CoA-carboxylase] ligase
MIVKEENIVSLDQVASTNDYMLECINSGKISEEGSVVVANYQSAGKGLEQNRWESEAGKNLTFSIFLKPKFLKADQQFQLTKIVSLAVFDFIRNYLPNERIKVKWPNDVYVGNKKIAGILINNTIRGKEIMYTVVGIGININQQRFTSDIKNATSLWHYLSTDLKLDYCLKNVLSHIEKRYRQLKDNDSYQINFDYKKALYRLNDFNLYKYKETVISARITGVNEYGQIKLIQKDGTEIICDLKEIEFII